MLISAWYGSRETWVGHIMNDITLFMVLLGLPILFFGLAIVGLLAETIRRMGK
ncbi:MAG: hypothetical protein PHC68_02705 [Syntrophorhabdaceae bacterium]|nr:hypothetical protein [Syntrophorhabdaceae bacterium]